MEQDRDGHVTSLQCEARGTSDSGLITGKGKGDMTNEKEMRAMNEAKKAKMRKMNEEKMQNADAKSPDAVPLQGAVDGGEHKKGSAAEKQWHQETVGGRVISKSGDRDHGPDLDHCATTTTTTTSQTTTTITTVPLLKCSPSAAVRSPDGDQGLKVLSEEISRANQPQLEL